MGCRGVVCAKNKMRDMIYRIGSVYAGRQNKRTR